MNRRQFIHSVLLGAGVPLVGINHQALGSNTPVTQRRLVLVELVGANDGLNTLAPFSNDHYHNLRPSLGLSADAVLALDDTLGMHDSLRSLLPLWERGELAWVQGLGYPKANRSHFKSISLWETAGDGLNSQGRDGWITHAIEHQLGRSVSDPHGISLSGNLDVFASESGRWLSAGSVKDLLQENPPVQPNGKAAHATLALLQQRLATLDSTLARLSVKLKKLDQRDTPIPAFKAGGFGEQLRQVSMMIAAGLDTPVYRVRLTGFDTHKNQQSRHQRLLKTLANGLSSFSTTLKQLQEWDNTLIMTYSEFGRRASENRSGGTDHGTAAPHMVLGGSVQGGLYGKAPDLARLPDGDPLFTMDYRALYHTMLVDGLGADRQVNLLNSFADQGLHGLLKVI